MERICSNVIAQFLSCRLFRLFLFASLLLSFFTMQLSAQIKARKPAPTAPIQIERQLQATLRRTPDDFTANHNLGEFYVRAGILQKALPFLIRAYQINPNHYPNSYDLALAYVKTGKLSEARQLIQLLLPANNKAELHNLLGLVEETADNKIAAAESYQRAAQLDPNEKNIFDLGNILLQLTAANEALQIFQFGVSKHPQSAQLRVGRGIAEYALGKHNEAVETLCQAVDLAPQDPRPYVFLGEMYGVSVELADEITRRFEAVIKRQPNNALAHYYYAMNLWKGKRSAQADASPEQLEMLLTKAITLDPQLADGFYQLGVLYFDQKKYPAAITNIRRATQLKPNDSQMHFKLAQAYQQTGHTALASSEFALTKKLKAETRQAEMLPKQ